MADIHDRRPVAVSGKDARRWFAPALSPEQATHIARTAMLGTEAFEWYKVSTERNRGADAAQLTEALTS
jgi:putative SOS response-associated peptidase YedK